MNRPHRILALVAALLGGAALVGCQSRGSSPTASAEAIHVEVTEKGFEPAEVSAVAGRPVTLVFTRRTDQTCIKAVEFDNPKKSYPLPLHQAVTVNLPASAKGELDYQCNENMFSGKVVVR